MLRWVALALPLTFGGVALSARAADVLASQVAASLTSLAALLPRATPAVAEDPEPSAPEPEATEAASGEAAVAQPQKPHPSKRPGTKTKSAPAAPCALFVPASTVLRLAESRVRPRGVRVAATRDRPAGLRLSNVNVLGIGVRDGDVLTHAAGRPALEASAVIEAVLVARARHASTISGVFYRGAERCTLTVEQPYPRP